MCDHWMITCDNCAGEGGFVSGNAYVGAYGEIGYHGHGDEWGDTWHDCPACHGAGWVYDDEPPPEIDPEEAFQ